MKKIQPMVTRCINSKCTNQLSGKEDKDGKPISHGFFDLVDYVKNGIVFTWEVTCPMCGATWWIDSKKDMELEREKKRLGGEPIVNLYNRPTSGKPVGSTNKE